MQLVLQSGCEHFRGPTQNATAASSLLSRVIKGCAHINDSSFPVYIDIVDANQKDLDSETDAGAVLYIVAVLVFYSFGIIVMIVKYLRREQRELEEERILDDFFRSMPQYKKEREQTKMNKIAIHAFHALTSYSETLEDNGESSGGEDEVRKATKTGTNKTGEHKLNGANLVPEASKSTNVTESHSNHKEATVTPGDIIIEEESKELETHL